MSDETLELLWSMLTNEQLMELRKEGAMDPRTMFSFKTELFKRCLIDFDEVLAARTDLEDAEVLAAKERYHNQED